MEKKTKSYFMAAGVLLLLLFLLLTLALPRTDVQAIGPRNSPVGFGTVNGWFHALTGVHMTLYDITDWMGVAAVLLAAGFAVLGLCQWIHRKNIGRVDPGILLLGGFYLLVIGAYVYFEYNVVNRRPVLINGYLEASYPSSTTMLLLCVMPTAMLQFHRLIRKQSVRRAVNWACGAYAAFAVVGRLLSGVHWLTDILGGALLGGGLVLLYAAANRMVTEKAAPCPAAEAR